MKRVSQFLIRLYPAWWRRRYGKEFEALVEDSGSHDVWDLLRGAMEMQMKTWSFGKIVTACGLAGLALAAAVGFSFPPPYSSTAILRVPGGDKPAPNLADMVNEAAKAALTRRSLVTIINDQNLYTSERKTMPMEDVIDQVMRRDIHITPILLVNTKKTIEAIEVRFDYPDPSKAQPVTRLLTERFQGFQVGPPSPPQRLRENYHRFRLAVLGLLAGFFFGVVLALFWRKYTWRGDGPPLASLRGYGIILTPLNRFLLCLAISVLATASAAIFELWILPYPGLMRDQLDVPLARRLSQIVLLPFEYLVEGFGLRSMAINIAIGFLFCAATWTGILYALCALVESSLQKITHRTRSS